MGTQAVRGGGGGAAAPERRADDRQQLPGGLVRGRVLLRPLGEWPSPGLRRAFAGPSPGLRDPSGGEGEERNRLWGGGGGV